MRSCVHEHKRASGCVLLCDGPDKIDDQEAADGMQPLLDPVEPALGDSEHLMLQPLCHGVAIAAAVVAVGGTVVGAQRAEVFVRKAELRDRGRQRVGKFLRRERAATLCTP